MRVHPTGRCPKTTKADKKDALRLQTHLLLDRPTIDWPCRPDYDATISFGLPFEPEDSQYGKSRFTLNLVARDGIMFLSCMSDNRSVGLSG